MQRDDEERRPVDDLIEILELLADGAVLAQLTDAMRELANSVLKTGKAGNVDLKFRLENAGGNGLWATGTVAAKVPVPECERTKLFFDPETGSFSRNDPRQGSLPFGRRP